MEVKKLDVLLLKLLLLSTAGIIVSQTLEMDDMTSLFFLMTFPLTALLWLRSVRKRIVHTDIVMILAVVGAGIAVLLDLLSEDGRPTFEYLKKLIMFTMALMFLQTAYKMRIGTPMVRFIDRLADVLTLFLIYMYFTENRTMHMLNGYITRYLTFCFSNPNTTGLFLTCLYMLELYRLFAKEAWYFKVLHIIMAALMAFFILETQSRNSLLVMVLFTVGCFWLEFRSRRKLRITKGWARIIAWFPLLFVVAYMLLINTSWIQNMFSFLVEEGKLLDSRMRIWTRGLEIVVRNPFIGSYYQASDGTGVAQLHNSHLDIAVSYGIPILLLVSYLLTAYLHQKGRYYDNKAAYSHILGFACAIMLGIGEAALFSGGLGIYIFVGLFLLLSSSENTDRK